MTTGLRYFLTVAEEKSISQAAKKLFVTQQALSEQMKRLEEQYKTTLFIRNPDFVLTPAGEALLRLAQAECILENSLEREFEEIKNQYVGSIRVGIPISRIKNVFAQVMEAFNKLYPYVSVSISQSDTTTSETMLLNGSLDLFLGRDCSPRPEFEQIPLGNELVRLVVSKNLLLQHLGKLPKKTIKMVDVIKLPLIIPHPPSKIHKMVDSAFVEHGFRPNYVVTVSDYDAQIELALRELGAGFVPEMIARQSIPLQNAEEQMCMLPISEIHTESKLSLVRYKNAYRPKYLDYFTQLLCEYYV